MNEIAFPALGFYSAYDPSGQAGPLQFRYFSTQAELSRLDQGSIRRRLPIGMWLADSAGKSWVVQGIRPLRSSTPYWRRILMHLLFAGDQIERFVEYDLAGTGDTPLADIQDRMCAVIDGNPADWVDDELIALRGGDLDVGGVLETVKAGVRKSTSIRDMIEKLDIAWLRIQEELESGV